MLQGLRLSASLTAVTIGVAIGLGAYLFGIQVVVHNLTTNVGVWFLTGGVTVIVWAMMHFTFIPAFTTHYDNSLIDLIRRRGHLLFSGWRLWFTISIVFLSLGAVVFVGAFLSGNGDLAYKAGIVVVVSALLLLKNLKRMP